MKWILVWVALAGSAQAEEWRALTGAEIAGALVSRVIVYQGGQRQGFMADGFTTYESRDTVNMGEWRVEGGKYCSIWPPSDLWACYGVEVKGIDVRFVGEGGEVTVGRYGDL